MNCLNNVDRAVFRADLVKSLTNLYTYKGKDFYYEEVLKNYMKEIINNTIYKDVYYASKLLDLNVSEARLKAIAKNDSNPKTKDEIVVANLKRTFIEIQDRSNNINLTVDEFEALGQSIFRNVVKISFNKKTDKMNDYGTKPKDSPYDRLNAELNLYVKIKESKRIESIQIITRLFVDLLHMKCFNVENEFLCLVIQYCLLFTEDFNVFKYASFFEEYYNMKTKFDKAIAEADYMYNEGLSDPASLNIEFINLMLNGYKKADALVQDQRFNKDYRIKKIDVVMSAILKLDTVFSRDDVKRECPMLSDTTINRALKELKDEGKIKPNGTGRSATWIKLVEPEFYTLSGKQANIFDFMEDDAD